MKKIIILGSLITVLLFGVLVQFYEVDHSREDAIEVDLAKILPEEIPDWSYEDLPLGDTEAIDENVRKRLNLDSFLYRQYNRGEVYLRVYMGYWGPGRMDTRLVASHTPDRCWTENGWTLCEKEYLTAPEVPGCEHFKPGQYRELEINEHREYVYYWHLVNEGVYDYGKRINKIPHPGKYLRDFIKQFIKGKPEQFFVRISSNKPFDYFSDEEAFSLIMQALYENGLGTDVAILSHR